MGSIGPTELLLIALVVVLIFGAGRIAEIGKGLGQGIKNFKLGIRDEPKDDPAQLREHAEGEQPEEDEEAEEAKPKSDRKKTVKKAEKKDDSSED